MVVRAVRLVQQTTEAMLVQLDTWQQPRAWASVPVAVVAKYRDDHGGRWATLLAHYGFLSLFPFLLVLATYGGGAVLRTAHAAMDVVWAAPAQSVSAYLRSHLRVAAVGMMLLVATLVAAVAGSLTTSAGSLPGEARAISLGVSALLSAAVFLVAFHSLTSARPTWREVMPGAVAGALGWTGLHAVGGLYIDHVVREASLTYGAFAVVIGLLSWLYLQTRLLLLAAELNTVLAGRLWPRPLVSDGPRLPGS